MRDSMLATGQLLVPDFRIDPAAARPAGIAIRATNDQEAMAAWMAGYRGRPNTFESYFREAERFWMWMHEQALTLKTFRYEDLLRYKAFLASPPPDWINKKKPVARHDPAWRPFRRALGPASIRQAESILTTMFAWLVDAKYLPFSPLALVRRERKTRGRITRFLTRQQWDLVCEVAAALPRDTPERRAQAVRDRWLLHLLYVTAMRISEATSHSMGAIQPRDVDGTTKWSLAVTGKGNKERDIPVTPALLDELRTYRTARGLPAMPSRNEATPLVGCVRGQGGMTRNAAYRIIKALFKAAAERAQGPDKDALQHASPHWLRHTRAARLVGDRTPLNSVREVLGHASLTTTSLYTHEELDRVQSDVESADRRAAQAG